MRRIVEFACEGSALFGTVDEARGTTGLLIVSGGNEIRIGAHRGMAWLAAEVSGAGYPAFRYDRRGVGDSEGANGGFETGGPDLTAAVAAFRAEQPQLRRIVGFGNCDAASTLALWGHAAGLKGMILGNPWVIESSSDLPPAAAVRARYADRLRRPRDWWRLLSGSVDLRKLVRGLFQTVKPSRANSLADRIGRSLSSNPDQITMLLAERDNTALAYISASKTKAFGPARDKATEHRLASSSHSFASAEDKLWLRERVLAALR
jgi:exosortase A-associated hydrolase 1